MFRSAAGKSSRRTRCGPVGAAGSQALDDLAASAPEQVELPVSKPGIGPLVVPYLRPDGKSAVIMIGGGVQCTAGVSESDLIGGVDLGFDATALVPGRPVTFRAPTLLPLPSEGARLLEAREEILLSQAELEAGHLAAASEHAANAAALAPDWPPVRASRARMRITEGDLKGALEDADAAASVPALRFVRAQVRLRRGDEAGAVSDVADAYQAAPGHLPLLLQKIFVETQTLRLDAAERDLRLAFSIDPLDPSLEEAQRDLRLLQHLSPTHARAYARARVLIPFVLTQSLVRATRLSDEDPDAALLELEKAQQLVSQASSEQRRLLQLDARILWAKAAVLQQKGGPEDLAAARTLLEQLSRAHPTWTSPRFALLSLARDVPAVEAARQFVAACRQPDAPGDVVNDELVWSTGAGARSRFGLQVLVHLAESSGKTPVPPALMAQVGAILQREAPSGPMAELVRVMNEVPAAARLDRQPKNARTRARMAAFIQLASESAFRAAPALQPHPLNLLASILLLKLSVPAYAGPQAPHRDRCGTFFRRARVLLAPDWYQGSQLRAAGEWELEMHSGLAQTLAAALEKGPAVGAARSHLEGDPRAALDQLEGAVHAATNAEKLPGFSAKLADILVLRSLAGATPSAAARAEVIRRQAGALRRLAEACEIPAEFEAARLEGEALTRELSTGGVTPEMVPPLSDLARESMNVRVRLLLRDAKSAAGRAAPAGARRTRRRR